MKEYPKFSHLNNKEKEEYLKVHINCIFISIVFSKWENLGARPVLSMCNKCGGTGPPSVQGHSYRSKAPCKKRLCISKATTPIRQV